MKVAPGWTRLSRPGVKGNARWVHESGWEALHCGHQTAIYPYWLKDPAHPDSLTLSQSGYGFTNLTHVFETVAEIQAGRAVTVPVGFSAQYGADIRRVRGGARG